MINNRLSNIQKETEKNKIIKNINKLEDLKAESLLSLGIVAFEKIRKNIIEDDDFNEICEVIKNYDIEIYNNYTQLRSLEDKNMKTKCECGYLAFHGEKFCSQCGNSLVKEEKEYIICLNCNEKIDVDSNYCVCCGNKVENITNYYEEYIKDDEVYCETEGLDNVSEIQEVDRIYYNQDESDTMKVIEEETLIDKSIEEEGREFLRKQE